MKKLIGLIVLFVLVVNVLFAQADRWQQHIDYKINAALDVQTNIVKGSENIVYTNNSPDTLRKVYFHLYWNAFQPTSMVQYLNVSVAHTYSAFTYNDYNKLGVKYNGKQLPGVPKNTVAMRAILQMKYGFYFNANYYHNSSIMLNDANTFRATAFQIVGAKAGYKGQLGKKQRWHVFAGADNLLDTKYSLGNDINAAANRFFNVAPGRLWYAGIGIE